MNKIVALNGETDTDANSEDEIQVTKEAEETIAVSEYMRALSYKANSRSDDAVILFKELLETRVLNEISLEDKVNKLFSVRYNCHKNLALIYEERKEVTLALEQYVKAIELDDTEVYMMHRMGQLSLKTENWELAQLAFHKCLAKSPNHWPSADGILQCLCRTANIMGAYGWALKWYLKDNNYTRGEDVLIEITETFKDIIPFFEKVWKTQFKRKTPKTDVKKPSVFPEPNPCINEETEKMVKPDLDKFKNDALNWYTVGKFIVSVYKHLEETKQSILFILTLDDIFQADCSSMEIVENQELVLEECNEKSNSPKVKETLQNDNSNEKLETEGEIITVPMTVDLTENDNSNNLPTDEIPEEIENAKTDPEAIKKPRRRCSDLSFLEQWGWHKNRRYSSRKRSQQDKLEYDTSLNAYLRRIFAKYFEENFDSQPPFLSDKKSEEIKLSKKQEEYNEILKSSIITFEEFQRNTEDDFQLFLNELKSQNFDLIALIFHWLKYVSKYWEQSITSGVEDLYHEIFSFYLNHYDLATWNQLSNDDFNASFRMTLFFMEIDHVKAIEKSKNVCNVTIDPQWRMLYHHLMFNSGVAFVISDEIYEKNIIRLIWLDYCASKLENNLNRCVECLQHLEYLIEKQEDKEFQLKLPNLKQNNFIELDSIRTTRINIQRRISLSNVKSLYDNQNFKELCEILKESLIHSTEIRNSDDTVMKIQTQFEVLLESLWNLEQYEDCMIWSERCLCYAVKNLILAPTDTYRYEEWAESCNFILIYLEELILKESYEIFSCIEKFLPRLIQSITKILVHQFDAPFNKNNNPTHPVNCKRTWVILHQVLQRKEDKSPVLVKTKIQESNDSLTTSGLETEENIEDLLPQTILFLFTAHEFLGRRLWCTRDNGLFLLYILDAVTPKTRLPVYDAIRDIIAEYLEQVTYCLYGYPPKKARSKHIEEHDSKSIDFTFERAIQIFDLYRPENLPEFNSFKLESISADFETLLLKIIPLIPKDLDPTEYSKDIKHFISGENSDLPTEGFNKLPHRLACIFYLLADFYLKNRDLQKSIKYYILDLTCEPNRLDSWAGISLSKASKLETKLNSCSAIDFTDCLDESESIKRCFEQCIKLNRYNTVLWIEYGTFAYTTHSFFSRKLKHCITLSMEQFAYVETIKEKYLQIAYDSFITADKTIKDQHDSDDDDSHDEKWLHHFMLGKIAEKRKEHPKIYLDHYLMAASLLYENNCTYPIKINHNNPSTLSVEALEVFYRTSSAIIKYLEQHEEVKREIGRLFLHVLKDLASSPFAYNQAKIDDNSINAFKRKLAAEKAEAMAKKQKLNPEVPSTSTVISEISTAPITSTIAVSDQNDILPNTDIITTTIAGDTSTPVVSSTTTETIQSDNDNIVQENKTEKVIAIQPAEEIIKTSDENVKENDKKVVKSRSHTPANVENSSSKPGSPSRRGSQESSATTTTTTGTATETSSSSSSSESDSSSSDSSSDDSESGCSTEDDGEKKDENTPFSLSELEPIYKSCIKNLEECVTRFPEHYKSIYRLVYHYLNAPEKLKSMQKCHQLLLGNYTTNLGTHIIGLFCERKNNNFFNGIWRIPSTEIDRPGSFSTHLVKCANLLLEVLRKSGEHKILVDMALQLHRNPDQDKRYVRDIERKELCKQSLAFCVQVMRDILKKNIHNRNDEELLELLVDIYKAHKKCIKHMNQKEALFSQLLIDTYRFFMEEKIGKMPDNCNFLDLAIKLCIQEIAKRKNFEKHQTLTATTGYEPVLSDHNINVTQASSRISSPALVDSNTANNNLTRSTPSPAQTIKTQNLPSGTLPGMTNKPSVQNPGFSSRPRGRPVGSKNTSSLPNLLNLQSPSYNSGIPNLMDATSLAALMAFYGNPPITASSLTKDAKYMNNFFSEYYKFLGVPSTPNISSIMSNLNSAYAAPLSKSQSMSSILGSTSQTTKTPPTTSVPQTPISSPKIPQFDIKNLIASAASQVAQTTQTSSATISVGSGQLTITPTLAKSSIPSTSSTKFNEPSHSKMGSTLSVTKVPQQKSPGTISVKPLSDLTGPSKSSPTSSTLSKMPAALSELPKSLTITATGPSVPTSKPSKQSKQQSQTQNCPEGGGKSKSNKKSFQSEFLNYPYGRPSSSTTPSPTPSISDIYSNLTVAAASQFPFSGPGGFNISNYHQQVSLLNSYADMLKQVGLDSNNKELLAQITKSVMPDDQQKRGLNYQKRTSKSQKINSTTSLPPPSQKISKSSLPSSPSSLFLSNQAKSASFAQAYAASLAASPPGLNRPTPTPSPSLQISPTKTLQQKLAEKQKANQMLAKSNVSASGSGSGSSNNQQEKNTNKKKDVDVIILD